MARRIRLDLMDANHTPQTGNGTAQDWPGGDGVLLVESATFNAATIALQIQAPGGTWVSIINYATTTAIGVTAAPAFANFRAPAGPLRLAAGAATGVVASVTGVPATTAG